MAEFKRSLTLFDMTMIAIGGAIGSGIFLTPATIARDVGTPWLMVAVWVMGGLITLTGALTFSEAAALLPHAGGQYVFLTRAYGGLVGFLFGWAYFLVCNAGALGALSLAFATYLGYFVPLGAVGTKTTAIVGLLFLTMINVLGVRVGAMFSNVFTVLKLVGIAGLVAVGLAMGSSHTTDFSWSLAGAPADLWGALALGMVGVLWSYGGWQHATYASAEIKNPQRTLPLAMTIAAVAVTTSYLLANLAYMFLLTPAQMAASPRVAADAVGTDWIFFALAGASVIVLRRTMPDAPRPYRVPGYPWVPLFFVATSGWFVAMTLFQKPAQSMAGLILLGVGIPVYYGWKRRAT